MHKHHEQADTHFHALEQRAMLAADLIVSSVTATSSFVHFFGERSVKSTVVVENIGDAKSTGTMTLDLFLSRDDALGTGDYQLASRVLPKILNASGRRVERFDELVPHDLSGIRQGSVLTPGDYRLIARITATEGATDSVTTNNTAVAAGLVPVQYEFGQVGQSTELTLRTTLPGFQSVEILLKGPGTGRLIPNGNNAPTLELTGTTSRTDLRILTPNQFVSSTFAGITVNGSIRKIYAPRTDISGNINISGSLGSMTIRDIVGSTWTIGGGQSPAVISLGIVQNSSLSSGQSIRSISAESWTTTDSGRDAIIAPWIGTLAIAGAFTPDLNLSGDGTSRVVLSKADITGAVSGQWDIIGGIKSLRAGSVATTFAANVTGAVSTFAVLGNMGGFVAASSFGAFSVRGNMTNAALLAGADLGSDVNLGGTGTAADTFGTGSIGSITITGAVTGSLFAAGLDPVDGNLITADDRFVDTRSRIGSIRINRDATGTTFAAPVMPKLAYINKRAIDTGFDPRFKTHLP